MLCVIQLYSRLQLETPSYLFFVKEKTALLNYVQDLIKYAAKLNDIDSSAILQEEVKTDQIKIKTEYDSQLTTARVNNIVSKSIL